MNLKCIFTRTGARKEISNFVTSYSSARDIEREREECIFTLMPPADMAMSQLTLKLKQYATSQDSCPWLNTECLVDTQC